jgi:hypothetical protein
MLSIQEQYNHPLWQRKRLEILDRDGWTCRCCDKESSDKIPIQFHVHHLWYERDLLIWEIDNEGLVTVCDECHKKLHNELAKTAGIIAFRILSGDIDAIDLVNYLKPDK